MKVILSRKGFDSAAGGYPSPYFVEDARLVSFPIPEDNKENVINTGKTYEDLRFDNSKSYFDVMNSLGLKNYEKRYVHLDPDINKSVLLEREPGWRGIFGQSSSAQAHLKNKEISEGDLFLFFGWFRDVVSTSLGYKYVNGTDKHIIWGYLQVGEIQKIEIDKEYEDWKTGHPHYFYKQRSQNTSYIAKENLDFLPSASGAGVFNFKDELVLTANGQRKKSVWALPSFFHPDHGTVMSYHENCFDSGNNPIWIAGKDQCILNSVGRGQEFVVDGSSDVVEWAKRLFK